MFKIGDFSKLCMVTVKALRFYDEEGLLKPRSVDKWTGYRYYESEQLVDAHRIVSLRQAGLSIEEIKGVMSGNDPKEILLRRLGELEREKIEADERLLRVTKLIDSLKENGIMNYQATVIELPELTVFYGVRKLSSFADMSEFIMGLGAECAKANPDLKRKTPDYCFVSYLDEEFTASDLTLMYAQAVEKAGRESENVKFQTMPAVTAVSVMVRGSYEENLPPAYAFAINWLKEHGYEIGEKPRECYIDGPWNGKKPDGYLTEIQIPVKKA